MTHEHLVEKCVVQSSEAPAWDDPISPATSWRGLVFASGELGADPATREVVPGGVAAQTRQALHNLDATLRAAGSSLEHVLKVNVYLNDPADYDAFNRVFAEEFPELPPARTTVGVKLIGRWAVEVELVAYIPALK